MRKTLLAFVAMLAALALAPSASAVKFGEPDVNNQYPWVGLMVAVDDDGEPLMAVYGFAAVGRPVLDGRPLRRRPAGRTWRASRRRCTSGSRPAPKSSTQILSTRSTWRTRRRFPRRGAETFNVCLGDPTKTDASGSRALAGSWLPVWGLRRVGAAAVVRAVDGSLTIPQTYDVGVVYDLQWTPHPTIQGHPFTQPTTYGTVADVGTLDALAASRGKGNIEFTVVGYGLQSVKPVDRPTSSGWLAPSLS